jgi:hypothetical protein
MSLGNGVLGSKLLLNILHQFTRDTFHDTHLYFRHSKRLSDLKYLSVQSVMILVVILTF